MQSFHTPDYPDVPDFPTAHCCEPNESAQCSQPETADPDNFSDRENTLSNAEVVELTSLEAIVERGLRAFWQIGQALQQILDKRLYRQEYGTFEDYCICRWEMSRRSAYQLIEAATVYENVRHGAQILPANERQARPLATLPPQKQQEAWAKAVSTAPNGRVTSTHVAQVAKEYQQTSEDACSESESTAFCEQNQTADNLTTPGTSTLGATEGDAVVTETTPSEVGANWRSCWNCYHCSREFLDDSHSFYCYQFGKLNFIEKDGNERGAECELWTYRQATPDEVKTTPPPTETFTLTLQLPTYLQPLIQDAARGEGLVLVDWVAKILEAALKASSSASEKTTPDGDSVASAKNFLEVSVLQVAQNNTNAGAEAAKKHSEQTAA